MSLDEKNYNEENKDVNEESTPTMDTFGGGSKYKSKYERNREKVVQGAASKTYEATKKIKNKVTHEKELAHDKAYNEAREDRYHSKVEQDLKRHGNMDSAERSEQERLKRDAINNTENNLNRDKNYQKDSVDTYTKWISKILTNLEEVYGLQATVNGVPLYAMDIKDLHSHMITRVKKNNKELNGKAGKYIVELSYLGDRLEFFSYNRVDFAKYKFLESVLPILVAYTTSARVKSIGVPNNPNNVTKILAVLQGVEADSSKFKKAVGYRLLRLFAILVYHNNIIDAGIVAKFIITQMALANVGGANKSMNRPDTRPNYQHQRYNNQRYDDRHCDDRRYDGRQRPTQSKYKSKYTSNRRLYN